MTAPVPPLAHLLHRLAPDAGLIPDAELLRRFAEERDEAAFELLVWRHGGLIWGVCKRVAPDHTTAEDAFQATSIALARHAASIRRAPSIAGWLYQVAYRAALRTRAQNKQESLTADRPGGEPDPAEAAATRELGAVIDAEVSQLPEPFREVFVLCELEGRSNAEVAATLGCAVGTVESRLTRARQKLRGQLARRGLALPAGVVAVVAVPGGVHAAAVRAATDPATVSPFVRELASQAMRSGRTPLRTAALALAVGGAIAMGFAFASPQPANTPTNPGNGEPAKPAGEPPAAANTNVPRQLGSSRFRHAGIVYHSAFSSDSTKLVTATPGSVSVWETKTGKLLKRVEQSNVRFHRVAFSPDDKHLHAVAGPTKNGCDVFTFDAETGRVLSRVEITKMFYRGAEFNPDGSRLAVYSLLTQGEAILFDPKAGKELVRVPAYFTGNGFTPDGRGLIVAGGEETIKVFDATTGKETGKLEQSKNRPKWARFASDTDAILAANNHVERWNLKQNVRVWQSDNSLPQGTGLEVSPDGKRVAHVSPAIVLLNGETGQEITSRMDTHWNCTSARFSPNSKVLAVTHESGTVQLLDTITGEPLPQSADLVGTVASLAFSPDGKKLSAVTGNKWVRWDLAAAQPRAEALARFICLSPDGRVGIRPDTFHIVDSEAEFVDPVTGQRVAKLDPAETGDTVVISRLDYKHGLFSGDGKRYVGFRRTPRNEGGGQTDLGLGVWDTVTGKRIAEQAADKAPYMLAAMSPNGKAVAVHLARGVPGGALGGKVQIGLWEPDTGKTLWTRDLGSGQLFAAFTNDGAKLVIQEYHLARLLFGPSPPPPAGPYPFFVLDALTGKELAKINGPNLGDQLVAFSETPFVPANARAVSPDGKTLAISGWDGTIYLWDLTTDREKAKFTQPGPVHELAFSPDGKTLAAASHAAPVQVYDLSPRAPGH